MGPVVPAGLNATSGWVHAASLELVNATAIAVTIPSMMASPSTNTSTNTNTNTGTGTGTGTGNSNSATSAATASYPSAVRYAWGDYPCCPGLDKATKFCPSAACPIVTGTRYL